MVHDVKVFCQNTLQKQTSQGSSFGFMCCDINMCTVRYAAIKIKSFILGSCQQYFIYWTQYILRNLSSNTNLPITLCSAMLIGGPILSPRCGVLSNIYIVKKPRGRFTIPQQVFVVLHIRRTYTSPYPVVWCMVEMFHRAPWQGDEHDHRILITTYIVHPSRWNQHQDIYFIMKQALWRDSIRLIMQPDDKWVRMHALPLDCEYRTFLHSWANSNLVY